MSTYNTLLDEVKLVTMSLNAKRSQLRAHVLSQFDLEHDPHAKRDLLALAADIYMLDPILAGRLIVVAKKSTYIPKEK